MTSAVLHIGFGKCGSSALQEALSKHPSLGNSPERPIEYVSLTPDGILSRSELFYVARRNAFGYESSVAAHELAAFEDAELASMAQVLAPLIGNSGGRVILSNEGWVNERKSFEESGLLTALGLECEVVAYARPPVEWINSAWWQWGAWTGAPFDRWLNGTLGKVQWADMIEPWQRLPGVEKITARLLPDDVVADFSGLLGVSSPDVGRPNTSLPGSVLRLYQRHSELRPGPHRSAIDFVLARHLRGLGGQTPWILDSKTIERIIEATRDSNFRFLEYLDVDSREQMRADPRWWDPAAYGNHEIESPGEQPPDAEAVDALAAEALQRVFDLDQDNRRLRKQLEPARDDKRAASGGR